MLIAISNETTNVSNADAATMCAAIQIQLDLHFCPAYNLKSAQIQFYADKTKIPGYAWVIHLLDNPDVADALGYHEEVSDKIVGYVFSDPILQNGGTVLYDPQKPQGYTVSATLSHEVLECLGDRFTTLYADNGNTSYCFEVCDPVEDQSYLISVNGVNVNVSNFVFNSWFNQQATAPANMPFDYLKSLSKPFSLTSGGYAIIRTGGPGTEQQIFGEMMPEWRKTQKQAKFARLNRKKSV